MGVFSWEGIMSGRLLRIAVLYWVIAVAWGVYMGSTENFTDVPVHAHLNLLGWVSLALCGVIYAVLPRLAETRLARLHFWLHNLSLPPLMVGVWLIVHSHSEIGGPIAGISSIVMLLAIVAFAGNIWLGRLSDRAGSAVAVQA
jgi:cbb3-type cytochrome oxidase subunit 1